MVLLYDRSYVRGLVYRDCCSTGRLISISGLFKPEHVGERRTFEERDHGDESFIARVTLPLGHNDGVLGLKRHMVWVRVEYDDFGEVTVEI